MKILIVIPCYNEEAVLPKTLEVLGNLIQTIKVKTDADTELLLVDDGSRDRTWQMISDAVKQHHYVHGIKLSHNRGHQNALWAGMEAAIDHCDAMVSIDADLQDDENVIIDMVQQVQEGKDIIYGVRKERKTDTFFKRFTALAFYKTEEQSTRDQAKNRWRIWCEADSSCRSLSGTCYMEDRKTGEDHLYTRRVFDRFFTAS